MKQALIPILFLVNFDNFQKTPIVKQALSVTRKTLLKNVTKHFFSNPFKEDIFQITVTGNSLLSAKARFDIIDAKGTAIYSDSFPATQLLGFETDISDLPSKKETIITQRVKTFFAAKNFLSPAIQPTEKQDPDNSKMTTGTWSEIKSNPGAIGFYYLKGEENGQRIVYLKSAKKVVVYFTCC